ncbi:hypothetical protein [Nocardia sp. alder85J]|uniref:hypothetical protein n=1 Tax=Nocardia sp. alder85J TaxID=2862949 RepID=UPI001CD5D733|nr:hypothetical protein [Nocardia sp. alder85J]MCX4091158.1 hypothetical protein [Nocardia sp. alder85J]
MAGEFGEPPVRYRGRPPRYGDRIVDPENPLPPRRTPPREGEDGWAIESYTPGEPRAGQPADWDDAPVRPVRRGPAPVGLAGEPATPGAGFAEVGDPALPTHRRPADPTAMDAAPRSRGRAPVESGRAAVEPGRTALEPGRAAADPGRAPLESGRAALEFGRAPLESGRAAGESGRDAPQSGRGAMESGRAAAELDRGALESGRGAVESGRAAPESGRGVVEPGTAERGQDRDMSGAAGDSDTTRRRLRARREDLAPAAGAEISTRSSGAAMSSRSTGSEPPADGPRTGQRRRGLEELAERQPVRRPGHAGSGDAPQSGGPAGVPRSGGPDAPHRSDATGTSSRDGSPDAPHRTDGLDGLRHGASTDDSHRSGGPDGSHRGAGADGSHRGGVPDAPRRGSGQEGAARRPAGDPRRSGGRGEPGATGRTAGSRAQTGRDGGARGQRRPYGELDPGRNGRNALGRNTLPPTGQPPRLDGRAARAAATPPPGERPAKRKAAKQKKQGPPLLDDLRRAQLEAVARERSGLRAAWAAFRIRTDDLRRANAIARTEAVVQDRFDRDTQQLTDRGYAGEGGGRMNVIGRPVEYRATTAQVAGLWPWSVGAGAPLIGTPLGSHLHTGAPVCFDPMNWFMRGSFITAPSLFVLGLNGFGKSSLVRRIVLGGVAQGITPLILADVKPDYRRLVEMVGGQVIDLGYGHGKVNPLAAGVLGSIVPLLDDLPALQLQVMQELRARQVTLIAGLVELVRGARVADFEETLISTALRILYREGSDFAPDRPPIMDNLLDVIVDGGDELMLDAGADNPDEYQEAIKGLRRSLRALTQGPFGAVFNGQTTTPIDTSSVAVCIDVSHIPNGDKKLKAAVMLACWADGFASVEAAHVLADAGMGPQRYFQVVMDELWQVLGLGDFMVDRVDELTRLQRAIATSLIMISHTIKDLQALGSEAAIAKALGFLERARAKIFGALPPEEIKRLDSTVPFTSAEEEMVTGWSAPQALTGEALKPGQARPPAPGTGKFLLKVGEDRRPGIPFHMEFTPSEQDSGIHETNQRFSEFGAGPDENGAYGYPPEAATEFIDEDGTGGDEGHVA